MPEAAKKEYSAFISYRRGGADEKWAAWLQHKLETYRTPKRLVKDGLPRRLKPLFRDASELAATPDLKASIREALDNAEYLIVVCSPRTRDAAFPWVNKEVTDFQQSGRGDQVLPFLIEGEPSESFPAALPSGIGPDDDQEADSPRVPLAADVRPSATEPMRRIKENAKLRLLATLLGCGFDDLRQRENERKRNRLMWSSVLLGVLLFGVGILAFYADDQRILAEQRTREVQARLLANESAENLNTDPSLALLLSVEAVRMSPIAVSRDALRNAVHATAGHPLITDPIRAFSDLSWDPSGRKLAISRSSGPDTPVDTAAGIWVSQPDSSGWQETELASSHNLDSIVWSPNGEQVIGVESTLAGEGRLLLFDPQNPERDPRILSAGIGNDEMSSLGWSPSGRWLVGSSDRLCDDCRVYLWDTRHFDKGPRELDTDGEEGSLASWSPIGDLLAVAMDETIRILDPDCPVNALFNLPIPPDQSVTSLTWNPLGTHIVGGTASGELLGWNLDNPEADPHVFDAHAGMVNAVSFDPEYRYFASAGEDGLVRLMYFEDPGFRVRAFSAGKVSTLAWHPSGDFLVTAGGSEPGIRLWNPTDQDIEPTVLHDELETREIPDASLLLWSPDGKRIATVREDDCGIRLWELADPRKSPICLPKLGRVIADAAWSPDGARLAALTSTEVGDKLRLVRSVDVGTDPIELDLTLDAASNFAWAPDGRGLIVGGSGGVEQWTLNSEGWALSTLSCGVQSDYEAFVHWASTGNRFATGDDYEVENETLIETLLIYDLDNSDMASPIELPLGQQRDQVEWAPGAKRIATSVYEGVKIWDLAEEKPDDFLLPSSYYVNSLGWHPSGNRLAAASSELDGSRWIQIWDLGHPEADPQRFSATESLGVIADADGSGGLVLTWDPSGKRMATTTAKDRDVLIWRLDTEKLIELACRRSGRNLTWAEHDQHLPPGHRITTCTELPVHPSFLEEVEQRAKWDHHNYRGEKEWHLDENTLNEAIVLMEKIAEEDTSLGLNPKQHVRQIAVNGILVRASESLGQDFDHAFHVLRETLKAYPEVDIDGEHYNQFCFFGSVYASAADAYWICKLAVDDPADIVHVSLGRGLTMTRLQNREGAIANLRTVKNYLLSIKEPYIPVGNSFHDTQQLAEIIGSWLADLEDWRNPIDESTLKALRCSSESDLEGFCI